EEDVTIGHLALVHGAYVEAGSLIGMHAAFLSRARIGAGSLIGGGALVLGGQEIPAGGLAAGVPAKKRPQLSEAECAAFTPHAAKYIDYAHDQADSSQALSLDDVYFE